MHGLGHTHFSSNVPFGQHTVNRLFVLWLAVVCRPDSEPHSSLANFSSFVMTYFCFDATLFMQSAFGLKYWNNGANLLKFHATSNYGKSVHKTFKLTTIFK